MNAPKDLFAGVRAMVFDCDGILTDGGLIYGPAGEALKIFNARDGLGLVLARNAGIPLGLLTGRDSAVAFRRAEELRFASIKLGRFDKGPALREIADELGVPLASILFMGDDLVDIPALLLAGVRVTVPEAPEAVRAICGYVTSASGGAGAVREVAELVLEARGLAGKALEATIHRKAEPGQGA